MLISSITSSQNSALANSVLEKSSELVHFCVNVSRETFRRTSMVVWIAFALICLSGCGEDSISEDVSGINRVLSSQYEIKSVDHLAKFYYEHMYDNPDAKLTIETFPQTHNRVKIVLVDNNPPHKNLLAEKFEIIAKQNETTWKIVVVNRNWKCKSNGEATGWGIEVCD